MTKQTNQAQLDPYYLRAVSDRILVRVDEEHDLELCGGKLIIPRGNTHEAYSATVVSVGPGRPHPETGNIAKSTLSPGMRVLVAGANVGHPLPPFLERELDGHYTFVLEDQILARVDEEPFRVVTREQVEKAFGKGAWDKLVD